MDRIEVESYREVGIYLTHIIQELEEIKEGMEEERAARREERQERVENKSKITFMFVTAFVAPIVMTFIVNAFEMGK